MYRFLPLDLSSKNHLTIKKKVSNHPCCYNSKIQSLFKAPIHYSTTDLSPACQKAPVVDTTIRMEENGHLVASASQHLVGTLLTEIFAPTPEDFVDHTPSKAVSRCCPRLLRNPKYTVRPPGGSLRR